MSGADRKRQKKLEQTRKKRELLKKQARQREARFQGASLLRVAQSAPFGPAWISASLYDLDSDPDSESLPALVTAVVTRRVRGLLLAESMVIDRTCLGIKNAMLMPLMTELHLLDHVDILSRGAQPLRACEPLEVQSVVFHALDYAKSLGFSAHEDFEIALLEPRPESLLETPLAKPTMPTYVSGPHDDIDAILRRLDERVGPGNYQFLSGLGGIGALLGAFADEDAFEDEEEGSEADEIETTGESSEGWSE
jgi:hypothetical protein